MTPVLLHIAMRAPSKQQACGRRASRSTERPWNAGGGTSPGSASSESSRRTTNHLGGRRQVRPVGPRDFLIYPANFAFRAAITFGGAKEEASPPIAAIWRTKVAVIGLTGEEAGRKTVLSSGAMAPFMPAICIS